MTKPKKVGKKKKPKDEDESAFPGKSFDELVGALLKVPRKKQTQETGTITRTRETIKACTFA